MQMHSVKTYGLLHNFNVWPIPSGNRGLIRHHVYKEDISKWSHRLLSQNLVPLRLISWSTLYLPQDFTTDTTAPLYGVTFHSQSTQKDCTILPQCPLVSSSIHADRLFIVKNFTMGSDDSALRLWCLDVIQHSKNGIKLSCSESKFALKQTIQHT